MSRIRKWKTPEYQPSLEAGSLTREQRLSRSRKHLEQAVAVEVLGKLTVSNYKVPDTAM